MTNSAIAVNGKQCQRIVNLFINVIEIGISGVHITITACVRDVLVVCEDEERNAGMNNILINIKKSRGGA